MNTTTRAITAYELIDTDIEFVGVDGAVVATIDADGRLLVDGQVSDDEALRSACRAVLPMDLTAGW